MIRRTLQDQIPEMQHYKGPDVSISLNEAIYHPHSNVHSKHSPNSNHMSVHSDDPLVKTQKQQTTQEITTVTKVVREVQQLSDQGGEYIPVPLRSNPHTSQYVDYIEQPSCHMYSQYQQHPHHQDFDHYPNSYGAYMGYPGTSKQPPLPPSPGEHGGDPSPFHLMSQSNAVYFGSAYDELSKYYRVTPSPGGPIGIDPYQDDYAIVYDYVGSIGIDPYKDDSAVVYHYASPSLYSTTTSLSRTYVDSVNGSAPVDASMRMFEDKHLQEHISKLSVLGHDVGLPYERTHNISATGSIGDEEDQRGLRWRDLNLTDVIGFLNNPNNVIKANAAAYLQHLCYMDDHNKQKTRALGGIPSLVKLLSNDSIEVYRNACGALRNLSYGRKNDENKRAIKNAGGIPALINLLKRSNEVEIKELVTGVIWNMSSCEDLKRNIIDDDVITIATYIIIAHSGWDSQENHGDTCWSTVFKNASGVLKNVSSAGEYARKKLRECEGLVDALLFVVCCAIDKFNIDNKIVENCMCILRNLSYRCQEVEDPNYDQNPLPTQSRVAANCSKGESLGCFGDSKKKKKLQATETEDNSFCFGRFGGTSTATSKTPVRGMELLWQPEVVQSYLDLLQSCSNPETLEAAAGALQNLAACYWQPSIEIRAAMRKEKRLSILVGLLRMEVDKVVCAVATTLRNLIIDQQSKELIGKSAMRDLVQKLPSGNPQHDQGTSDDTIAAVSAILNEVIKENTEFSRSLLEAGGVERLITITRQRQKYTSRVLKFAGQVLFTMWQHQDLRDVYRKHGWKEQDFVIEAVAARNAGTNLPNNANSTLNRPMTSQSDTRYEDSTMKRTTASDRGEHSGDLSSLSLTSQSNAAYLRSAYDELSGHCSVTPSFSGSSGIDPYQDDSAVVYSYVSPSPYGASPSISSPYVDGLNGPMPVGASTRMLENKDMQKHISKMSLQEHVSLLHKRTHRTSPRSIGSEEDQRGMRWRDLNLTEVIGFLNNSNNAIKANAAAYLQHLCYVDHPNKQKIRALGGIPPLVKLLSHDSMEVYKNACGALRNLSYGRQNDENKRAIKNAGGIPALINLLNRSNEAEIKELVTGVIWNMSCCEDLKRNIIDDSVIIIVTYIIIPHSGWDSQGNHGNTCWSTVFKNASGVLRNVSSAGEYARKKLRECEGLVDALLFVTCCAIDKSNIDSKIMENCVCILRNLSYRCQEVEDPNYDKNTLPTQSRVAANYSKGENLGCFDGSKKEKDNNFSFGSSGGSSTAASSELVRGMKLLWQPEVVQFYLALLQSCSNPETLEAAAGALQNLAACYWQPSIEIRAAMRKEKRLPILIELLRMEVDKVVCTVVTALRNLAIDQQNKEFIGKYAMLDLVKKLPAGDPQHDQGISDDTIVAVLATLNEVIKKNSEFSRSLLEAGGVERLMTVTRQRQKYTPRVLKFAGQVLFTMWQHQDLRDVYRKHGWKEQDFVTCNAGPNLPNNANSTLNRSMASQSGTRYEDRTMKRTAASGRGITSAFQGVIDIRYNGIS